jgi:hypothetical protein
MKKASQTKVEPLSPDGWLILVVARAAMDDSRPAGFPWNYDRGEIIADGVIHAIGICLGLIGVVVIIPQGPLDARNPRYRHS